MASAAGIAIVAPGGLTLFLKRGADASDHPGEWCFPGGHIEPGETPEDAARREVAEETGKSISGALRPIAGPSEGEEFVTFVAEVPEPFMVTMDGESSGWCWAPITDPPQPLHPGVQATLDGFGGPEANDETWQEGEHPRKTDGKFGSGGSGSLISKPSSHSSSPERKGAIRSAVGAIATKENLTKAARTAAILGVNALISHATHLGSYNTIDPQTEDVVSHLIENFSAVAGVTAAKGRDVIRSVIQDMIGARKSGAAHDEAETEDDMIHALQAVLKMLDGADVAEDEGFVESEHPRKDDGKFGSGGGSRKSSAPTAPPALSDKEKQVVSRYGEGNSYNINKYLRDPKAGKAEAKKNFGGRAAEYVKGIENSSKTLDAVIAKSPLKEDTDLFRGVSDFGHIRDAVANMKPGESFSLPTFSSTSRSKQWASDFMEGGSADKGMIVINAKAGANALNMDDYARHKGDEQEMLIGRNAPFTFDRYDEKTNTVFVTLPSSNKQGQDNALMEFWPERLSSAIEAFGIADARLLQIADEVSNITSSDRASLSANDVFVADLDLKDYGRISANAACTVMRCMDDGMKHLSGMIDAEPMAADAAHKPSVLTVTEAGDIEMILNDVDVSDMLAVAKAGCDTVENMDLDDVGDVLGSLSIAIDGINTVLKRAADRECLETTSP